MPTSWPTIFWYASSEIGGFFQTSFTSVLPHTGRPQLLQLREILFAKLFASKCVEAIVIVLQAPQLHTADFTRNRLGQLGYELDPPNALEGCQARVKMPENRECGCGQTLSAGCQQHIRLRNGQADRVGTGHDRCFSYRFMLQQDAFKFERADPVVGRFENVVGAADESQVTLLIGKHDVTASIKLAIRAAQFAVLALVTLHQPGRSIVKQERDLPLFGRLSVAVGDPHFVTRQRPAHRSDFYLLPRRVAGQCGGFGLAVAVADRQAPCGAHLVDDLRIERLSGAADLAQRYLEARQLLLDE